MRQAQFTHTSLTTGNTITEIQRVPLNFKIEGFDSKKRITENNWAFIDTQNLYKGVQESGWRINWQAFRRVLREQYEVTKAVAFMGYLKEYKDLYNYLRWAGFQLEFR